MNGILSDAVMETFHLSSPLFLPIVIETPHDFFSGISAGKMLLAAFTLFLTWLAVRFSKMLVLSFAQRNVRARLSISILPPVLRFVLWTIGIYLALAVFSPSPNALLAAVTSIGLAIGLGAQDLIKSLIGGLVILADRPYQLGDRVKIGEAYGEIDHIGLRSTKLTTPDDTRVTIPNSELLSAKAWNANSGQPDCQVVTELFLPHDADPEIASEICYESAYSSPYLLLTKPIVVLLVDRFTKAPFLQVKVKAYVYDHRMEAKFQSDITMRAKREFLNRGMYQHTCSAAFLMEKSRHQD